MLFEKHRIKYSSKNSTVNSEYEFDGYVFGQSNYPTNEMRYGYFNMSYNGCELIAVYNALKYLGRFKPLYEIISDFERNGGIWLDGVFGTKPKAVGRYLSEQGINVRNFRKAKEMDKFIESDRCFIIIYAHTHGIHTVMARGAENGGIAVYNRNNFSQNAEVVPSVSSLIKKDGLKMIVGYWIREEDSD